MNSSRGGQAIPEWIKEVKKNKVELERSAVKVEKVKAGHEVVDKSGMSFLSFPYVVKANAQGDNKLDECCKKRKCEEKINKKFSVEKNIDENEKIEVGRIKERKESLGFGKNREELLINQDIEPNKNQIPPETKSPCLKLNIKTISSLIEKNKTNKEQIVTIFKEILNEVKKTWANHEMLPKITETLNEILTKYQINSRKNQLRMQENLEKYEKELKKIFEYRKKALTAVESLVPVNQDLVFKTNLINTKKNVQKARKKLEEIKQELSLFLLDFRKTVDTEMNCEELEIDNFRSLIKEKKNNLLTAFIEKFKWSLSIKREVERKNFEEFERIAEELMSLNRSYQFSQVINEYKSIEKSATPKETQQYYYALLHQELDNNLKTLNSSHPQTIPVSILKPLTASEKLYDLSYIAALLFIGYTIYYSSSFNILDPRKIGTTFNDVRGVDECKEELEEIVDLLKNREKYNKIGAKVPRGVLLVGKPGTGKTLLAKAIAGEAGVKFISCSGSEFDEIFVGVGAKKIRTLFQKAKKAAPAIIFIDEIDAVGGTRRGRFGPGPHQQTLNQLLVEMDGFDSHSNIIVIAATNIPEGLDEALKRPGRFDKIVEVPMPNLKSRTEILDLYLGKIKKNSSVVAAEIAKGTTGFSGADLENLVNTAMLCAIKSGRAECNMNDIDSAKDRILLGVANRSVEFTDKEKLSLAIHEIGHVLAILYTQGSEDLHKTSILFRGNSYGKTSQIPNKEQLNITRKQALANLDVLVAGRVMQELILPLNEITSQCEHDLDQANKNANAFVTIGMFNELFGLAYIDDKDNVGPETKEKIDSSVRILLDDSYRRVKRLLQNKVGIAKELVAALVKKETMSKEEIMQIIDNYKR